MTKTQKPTRLYPYPPDEVSAYFFFRMCDDAYPDDASEWHDFKKFGNLPSECFKYDLATAPPIEFCRPPGTDSFCIIDLPLQEVHQTIPDDQRFYLNPARWDRVKKQLADGRCEHPWVSFNGAYPMLMDGRHRIVAMIRLLGMTTAPFVVEAEHLPAIQDWSNSLEMEQKV